MRDLNLRGLRRLLSLRQFQPFEHADLDELATIAENVVETTIPAGTVIATAGTRLRGVHLVLAGRIESEPRGRVWLARHVFGALEVFANREVAQTAIAATDLRTLQLTAADIGEVLEDNFGVLLASLRELAARLVAAAQPPARSVPLTTSGALGLVERLILLRQQLPFTAARLQALAALAHASEEVAWPARTIIARAGELATSGLIIIHGEARATRGDATHVLQAGSSIAHLETLAGLHHEATIETTTSLRALRSGGSAILDVIEDHTDVGLAMLATFAGALLDGPRAAHALIAA